MMTRRWKIMARMMRLNSSAYRNGLSTHSRANSCLAKKIKKRLRKKVKGSWHSKNNKWVVLVKSKAISLTEILKPTMWQWESKSKPFLTTLIWAFGARCNKTSTLRFTRTIQSKITSTGWRKSVDQVKWQAVAVYPLKWWWEDQPPMFQGKIAVLTKPILRSWAVWLALITKIRLLCSNGLNLSSLMHQLLKSSTRWACLMKICRQRVWSRMKFQT